MRKLALTYLVFFFVAVLCCGCSFKWGWGGDATPFEDSSTSGDTASGVSSSGGGQVTPLPEPEIWRVPPEPLTPEQAVKKGEVDQYLVDLWHDYNIVECTQGYSGDLFYWVDDNTLPPTYQTAPSWTPADLIPPAGVELGHTELELYSELRGEKTGTTPIQRPDFSNYIMGLTGAASLQDYLENYQVSGQPAGQDRLYAGLNSPLPNMGASGNINQFHGDVEQGTLSLIEIAVACPAISKPVEMVGVALSRDRANYALNFADGKVRLHVEFMTQGGGPGYSGHRKGGWDENQVGFVRQPGRKYGPGGIVPASLPGLGTQVEHRVDIFQSAAGDWWIAHNGNLLGYYPANLFTMLNWGACRASWYAEAFDPTPTNWTWSDVGSGQPDTTLGFGYLAYVRNPFFRDYIYGPWKPVDCFDFDVDNPLNPCLPWPRDESCYRRSKLFTYTPPWDLYFYVTGDGSNTAGCY